MKRVPKKIDNCPIYEAVLGVGFEPKNKLSSAITLFGPLFSDIDKEFSNTDNKIKFGQLPIANLPDNIRNEDPILREQPSLKIEAETYTIQIGARVILISANKEYVGWAAFSNKIAKLLGILEKAQFIDKVTRVGYRCINFFEKIDVKDIFDPNILEIQIQQDNAPLHQKRMGLFISREMSTRINININISNNASIIYKGIPKEVSVIDLDTYVDNPIIDNDRFSLSMMEAINLLHDEEKVAFYGLLKESFVSAKLLPTYE